MYTNVTIQSLTTVEQALKNLRLFCFHGISMVFPWYFPWFYGFRTCVLKVDHFPTAPVAESEVVAYAESHDQAIAARQHLEAVLEADGHRLLPGL